jgi:aryl-alcohol dehydrogenase-like predicted oxidoreductase
MKLALGGAQFGLAYGVANKGGQVALQEVSKILRVAYDQGIRTIDTAIAYGDSEAALGQVGVSGWCVVTKLPEMPVDICGADKVRCWVSQQVQGSLQRMQVDCLHGLLLHRPQQLLAEQGQHLYRALVAMKEKQWVEKIGVSIYQPDELPPLFANMSFDLVQAPLSIIDQRLVQSGWAERLHRKGVDLHVRSAFLQGLLVMPDDQRPAKFAIWNDIWTVWRDWLRSAGAPPLDACLRYVYQLPAVTNVVVGVDSMQHLEEILKVPETCLPSLPNWGKIDDRLLNPAGWSKL